MAALSRSYVPTYLPQPNNMGPVFGAPVDPETSGPPKSIKTQHMGSIIGRRGAGSSQITGGDQGMHAMGQYKKGGSLSGMVGGTL